MEGGGAILRQLFKAQTDARVCVCVPPPPTHTTCTPTTHIQEEAGEGVGVRPNEQLAPQNDVRIKQLQGRVQVLQILVNEGYQKGEQFHQTGGAFWRIVHLRVHATHPQAHIRKHASANTHIGMGGT